MPESPDTRDRLLAAAARLFHEQGYAATGVATILREADVNSGSLYYYFDSKEDLLAGVLDRYLDLLEPEILSRAKAAASDPVERVFALLGVYRWGLEVTGCTLGCPIGNLALELGDAYPALREKVEKNFQGWSGAVEGWLREAAGRFPPGTDLAALSRFVLVVMEGGMMQARARKSVEPYDDAVRQLRDYFDRLQASRASGPRGNPKNRNRKGKRSS